MKYAERKKLFVELRAQGLKLETIAQEIGVSKSTAARYNRDTDVQEAVRAAKAAKAAELYGETETSPQNRTKELLAGLKLCNEVIEGKRGGMSITNALTLKLRYLKEIRENERQEVAEW